MTLERHGGALTYLYENLESLEGSNHKHSQGPEGSVESPGQSMGS